MAGVSCSPEMSKPSLSRTTPLKEILPLAPPCSCRQCQHGCTMGSGILAKEDFAPMADLLSVSEAALKEKFLEPVELFGKIHFRPKIQRKEGKPYGRCIFFSEGGKCGVHPAKPLQCKIAMGCKPYGEALMLWFQENHLVDWNDKNSRREFEAYVKAGGKTLETC